MTPEKEWLVIVPALNEVRHIGPCLRSLLTGQSSEVRMRLIVADGGSEDGTRAIVKDLMASNANLHLFDNRERLQSAGINAAVAAYAGPMTAGIIRCDAHAAYPADYLLAVVESLEAQQAASVVVPMDSTGDTGFGRAAAWVVDTPFGSGGAAHRGGQRSGPVDHGHHAGMDLGWFQRIGGYDPAFSHNEDAEYDHRLREAGGTIWLDAGIRLTYVMRSTWGALARQYWNYGRGRARTVAKHGMRPRLRQMIPVLNLAGMIVCAVVSLFWPPAILWPLAYLATLLAIAVFCACRLRRVSGLWAGPALMAMHNAWAAGFIYQSARRSRI